MKSYAKMATAATLAASTLLPMSVRGEDAKPQMGGELVVTGQLDKTMFPGRNTDAGGMDVYLNACENLVEMAADRTIKPVLAKSWTMSDDLKTVTFHLNEGIQFHDGTPFNAEAVAFVFNEALAKKFLYVSLLEGLEKVVADSEYQVSFKLSKPSAALIPNLAYRTMCIFSPAAYKATGEEGLGSKIVGTGPFVMSEFAKGEYVLFKRNDKYWQKGKPYLDSIRILFVPEVTTRVAMLESGDVDRAQGVPDFDIPRLSGEDTLKVATIPSLQQNYVVINNLKKPLDDARVRQALNYAIDKAGIVKSVFAGTGATLSQAPTLTPGVFGFTDMREPGKDTIFAYDLDKAKDLLKQAGYEDRNGDKVLENAQGEPLSLKLWTRKAGKGEYQIAQLVQTFLEKLGIKTELTVLESATFSASLSLGPQEAKYDLALLAWTIPTADPDEPMMYMTHTKAWKPAGANRMFFSNPETDRLAEAAHAEPDTKKRAEYVRQWMAELLKQAPVIYLPTVNLTEAYRTYVHGAKYLPAGTYDATQAWIDKAAKEEQGISR
ncbi:ABC transporter substrate-binding protein [Microvirga zambiensis]|uniref:ABC transporter substrate-binding protein n=1 Tax=Microvirga zambiensis TaxID=1402137 RepID=UPI00191D1E6E|nr:ABC transporter substrate-binding protein [Microvirga zambiensis]